MKRHIQYMAAALACGLAALPLRAEVIRCDGVLGNSGEQGATLVRFNADTPALGLGVVADRYGTLWDRAGAGRLNRYAADGRLLASYRIPGERSSVNDAIAATGDNLMLCVDGGLHALSIDAPPGSTSIPLKIEAQRMSLSSHDGWVVASKGPTVFLANAAGVKKALITLQQEPWQLEIGPDAAVYVMREGKAYRAADGSGGLVFVGTVPGDRTQFLRGCWYGASGHSTLRRFDTAWQPAPGVVLGGNSGSFIGHVDEQAEVVNPRGVAMVRPSLFAVSGYNGILHLMEWREQENRLLPLRRIGSVASCPALALDREGRIWRLSGNWNWNDGPATPLRFGIPELEVVFGLAMQNSDSVVGYGRMWGKPSVLFGKFEKEIHVHRIETPTILPKDGVVAVAVTEQHNRPALLVLEGKGRVTAVAISETGQYQSDIGQVQFLTTTPVKQWTALATVSRDTAIAAGDGFVIKLAREGENWKETHRWNSWGSDPVQRFGGPIWLATDAGRLWVSDKTRHRVVCFDLTSGRELAAFGMRDAADDDLASLNAPCVIAARGPRAIVFDSGNQRLVKLRITSESRAETANARMESVTIGGVEVPASCALARKEHPRLLFTTADLPRLRARLKNPRIAAELEHAKQLAAEKKAGAVLLGVLYYLTGEREYIDQAKTKLQSSWEQTYPLAADLVMGAMTPAEQHAEADRIVEIIKNQRWRPHLVHDLAAWGHGHDEFLDADLKTRYRSDLVAGIQYNNLWSQGRGGSSMSHGYYGEHFYSEWFSMAAAWSNATGQDWVSKCDFAAHTPEYYLFHYRPWTWPPQTVHIGVNAMCGHWEAITPAKFEGDNLTVLAAARFHDGVGQWWINEVISKISMGWGTSAVGQGAVWGKLLWYDPELPPVEPKMLPPARLFPENGHVVMRSDWTPDATYALFRCGRYGEIDGLWGRNNADNLHFIINKRGILAADTGAVHSLNNAALGFAGSQVHSDSLPHIQEYARQTIAHNSITVGNEPLDLRSWNKALLATVRSGGQSPIQDKSWWKAWKLPEPKPGDRAFKAGEIVAYETSPWFDYAAGDATHSYPPTRVKSITRQFVYLRPETFVVFDRVVNAEVGLETKWLLHTLYEPAFEGQKLPDPSLSPERQLVVTPDGSSTASNPEPGGRFLHAGGNLFAIDDRAPGMTGRLFVKILRPDDKSRVLRTVGGPWHEFEVEGINYGPTEDTYTKRQKERTSHDRENSIGLRGWRIELSPQGKPAAVNFLTVLQTANQSTTAMAPVEQIERVGQVGARVTIDKTVYEVTFATAGPPGGRITILQAGKPVVDRALAAGVENNYRKWSGDPRYKTWITRPEYRNFIGAQELQVYRDLGASRERMESP